MWSLHNVTKSELIGEYLDQLLESSLTDDTSILTQSVVFPAYYLETGKLYRVSLTVTMVQNQQISTTVSAYIYVKPQDLELAFTEGTERSVGYHKVYVVDIITMSKDPDLKVQDHTGWKFLWVCYRSQEPRPSDEAARLIPIPIEMRNTTAMTDKGGCFGTGPGILDVSESLGILTLNTNFSPLKSTIVIEGTVFTPNGKVATTVHRVQITEGDPPPIKISCNNNCKSKVNPSDDFSLYGSCLHEYCISHGYTVNWTWSLSSYDSTEKKFVPVKNISSLVAGTGTQNRGINFKGNSLAPGTRFMIRVDVISDWAFPAYKVLEFATTRRPYGGHCVISPLHGIASSTLFTITCSDWINDETLTSDGLTYKAYNSEDLFFLTSSDTTVMKDIILRPGREEANFTTGIVVEISNYFGAIEKVFLEVQVKQKTLTAKEMSELVEGVKSRMGEGNVDQGRQIAMSAAAALNANATSAEDIDYATTTLASIEAASDSRKKLRAAAVTAISSHKCKTVDCLKQTFCTTAALTDASDEVTQDTQRTAIGSMSDMTDTLKQYTDGSNGEPPSVKDTLNSASCLIAGLANVGEAAQKSFQTSMTKADEIYGRHNDSYVTDYDMSPTTLTSMMYELSTVTESPVTAIEIATTAAALEEAVDVVRDVSKKTYAATKAVAGSLLKSQAPGQTPVKFRTKSLELQAERKLFESAGNSETKTKDGSVKMPSMSSILGNRKTDFVDTKSTSNAENQNSWSPSAKYMASPIIDFSIGDSSGEDLNITNSEEEFEILLDISASVSVPLKVQPQLQKDLTWGTVHTISIPNQCNAIYFYLLPENTSAIFDICVSYEILPSANNTDCNMTYEIPRQIPEVEVTHLSHEEYEEMRHSILITPEEHFGPGTYYFLVYQQLNISFEVILPDLEDPKGTPKPFTTPTPDKWENSIFAEVSLDDFPHLIEPDEPNDVNLTSYIVQFVAPCCRFWNDTLEEWQTTGVRTGNKTNLKKVQCFSTHLTSFGSDFFVPPNTIDFGSAYSNLGAKLADNYAVLLTICLLIAAYIIIGVWAHFKDRQDVKKWGVTPLEDNMESEKYLYLITVTTGMQGKAGTTSNIFFCIAGDREETGVRKLSDGKRKKLSRGSQVRYVATTENVLGRLQTLRIWHDNSGKGDDAGWYLDNVQVSDLQSGRTYAFLVNQWLAVDEGDGQIDRLTAVASPHELTAFSALFASNSKKNLTDGHLWVSVFLRPYQSNYTRLQRLSVVISVTFLTMVVNAMFYETEPPNVTRFELGFFTVTSFQLWVSIMGSVIVLPPSIIMDQIFRKARPKPSKTDPLMKKMKEKQDKLEEDTLKDPLEEELKEDIKNDENKEKYYTSSEVDSEDDEITRKKKLLRKKMKKKKKKSFPWWTVFIGWTLVIAAIFCSAFFVFSYSMQWGKEKSNSWLISMLLSVFQSVMIIQPLKVFMLAAIVAIILKKPDVEDLDDEERKKNGQLMDSETVVTDMQKKGRREKIEMKPVDQKKLERIRKKRENEVEMLSLMKQIVIYGIYIIFLLFLSQQNRNSNAYFINQNIKNMFVQYGADEYEKFMKPAELIEYVRNTVVPAMYWVEDYNGDMVNWMDRFLMTDKVSFRIGSVRLRQVRVEPDKCKVLHPMTTLTHHCNVGYETSKENKGRYKPGWIEAGNASIPGNSPWAYRTMGRLDGAPIVGRLTTYNGGGFAVDLFGSIQKIHVILDHLEDKEWLDKYTRALFIEFGILNPNVNLFSRVCLFVEFSNTGLAFYSHQINTFQLYSYVGSGAAWIIFCEFMVFVFIVIFLVRVCKKIKKSKRTFFRSFWNTMEFCKVIFSIVAISMYMMKNAYVKLKLKDLSEREGEFMNFHRLALWNETFIYLVSFVCFVSILECLNLLRFNVRLSMLARTLRTCSTDLAAFSFTFITVFLAFVQFAFIAFSSTMEIYKGFITACESMVGHLLGDLDMNRMRELHGLFGVAFYIVFICLMMFIVLNMFFSIMGDAFSTVKEKLKTEPNEYEMLDFIMGIIFDLIGWEKKKPLSVYSDDEDETGTEDEDQIKKEDNYEKTKDNICIPPTSLDATMKEAPPPATYASPEKSKPNALPPLPKGPPVNMPVLSKPLPVYYGNQGSSVSPRPLYSPCNMEEQPCSPVPGQVSLPNDLNQTTQCEGGKLSSPAPSCPTALAPLPPSLLEDSLPPPISYEPPPEEQISGMAVAPPSVRPIDFLNLPPIPDNRTLYGGPFEIFFGRSSMRPIASISPAVAKKPTSLPPIKTGTVLCRLEDIEARLNAILGDEEQE